MRRPVVVQRRGPGLLGTMARTAVIAGTATTVARGVGGAMDQKAAQQQAAAQQQQQAAFDAGVQQAQMQQLQQQQQAVSADVTTDLMIAQLRQLADLQAQGILTPDEFAQQKARILGNTS